MAIVSRGFRGRRERGDDLPPGQYLTRDFPVLTARPTQFVNHDRWKFTITDEGGGTHSWNWAELMALPSDEPTVDLHCVTKWSKLQTSWRGVSLDTFFESVETAADFALVRSYGGYTTNLPLEDLLDGKAWIVHTLRGRGPAGRARRPGPVARAAPVPLEDRRSGSAASSCATTTSPASGRSSAITTTATRGASSATRATDLAAARRLSWLEATVVGTHDVALARARRWCSTSPGWPGHLPGQHVDIRLTAEDGYSTERSYSIAAPADGERVDAHRPARRRRGGVALPRRRRPGR